MHHWLSNISKYTAILPKLFEYWEKNGKQEPIVPQNRLLIFKLLFYLQYQVPFFFFSRKLCTRLIIFIKIAGVGGSVYDSYLKINGHFFLQSGAQCIQKYLTNPSLLLAHGFIPTYVQNTHISQKYAQGRLKPVVFLPNFFYYINTLIAW